MAFACLSVIITLVLEKRSEQVLDALRDLSFRSALRGKNTVFHQARRYVRISVGASTKRCRVTDWTQALA